MADIQTTSEGWYPGWRPDPTVRGTVETPTTFIDKSGVFFREVWIAGVACPVPVAVLAKNVRVFNPAIRYGAVSFGLVLIWGALSGYCSSSHSRYCGYSLRSVRQRSRPEKIGLTMTGGSHLWE